MVNKISINDLEKFNELGFLVNSNFINLYNLKDIIESLYDDVYGYYLDNELVGFVHITKLYETMDIVNIVVGNDYRKQGIATKLINYVVNLYDDVTSVMLEVNENNITAISLYENNGFRTINIRNNYYGSDNALIMKRDVENERC